MGRRKLVKLLRWIFPILLACFLLLAPLSCKKSPTMPNADVLNRPVIWLNTSEVSFAAYEAGGNPAAQSFKVKNSGKNSLKYDVSDDAEWLSVEPASGSSSGQLVEHTILVNKAGLTPRDEGYVGTIMVVSADAYNNPQRVTVNLKLSSQPPPVIWASPLEMAFSAKIGQNPSSQTLKVKNVGEGTLAYEINWDASWLSVAPTGGTSAGGEKAHTVSVASSTLAQGNYDGIISISAPDASNTPQLVMVSLRVGTAPPPSTENKISITCNPSSGGTGTTVSIPISIKGNLQAIESFGLELTFDTNMFTYNTTKKGSLTGSWAFLDGNASGGVVTIGGLAGSGNTIAMGSSGSIAIVTLNVTGSSYSDGHVSQVTIRSYSDDISGMTPQPTSTSFTLRK
jgi:Viral BACON domain